MRHAVVRDPFSVYVCLCCLKYLQKKKYYFIGRLVEYRICPVYDFLQNFSHYISTVTATISSISLRVSQRGIDRVSKSPSLKLKPRSAN